MLTADRTPRIAVVGGGISGLSAAEHLRRYLPHAEVHLFDTDERLGGVIRTEPSDGFLIEGAADQFMTCQPTALELCQRVGLGDHLVENETHSAPASVLRRGRLEPIPAGFAVLTPTRLWPLLSSRIFSPWGKLRSSCEWLVPPRRDPAGETLQEFVCRRFGREMFDRLVQPLVGGIYSADPRQLSVAATLPRFVEMEQEYGSLIRAMLSECEPQPEEAQKEAGEETHRPRSRFMSLRGGMGSLIDALAAQIPASQQHLGKAMTRLLPEPGGWSLRTERHRRSAFHCDAAVLATPAPATARLLEAVDPTVSKLLSEVSYASCAVVTLAYRRHQIADALRGSGFVVPLVENRMILSCNFSSLRYGGRAPEGTVLLRVFIGGACQSGLLRLPNEQLKELAELELSKVLRVDGPPLLRHVVRHAHAMPQYRVGHRDRVAKVEAALDRLPALALAGGALRGVGIPGCIESGQAAARKVIAGLQARHQPLQSGSDQDPAAV